jgi:hypothetical protein
MIVSGGRNDGRQGRTHEAEYEDVDGVEGAPVRKAFA